MYMKHEWKWFVPKQTFRDEQRNIWNSSPVFYYYYYFYFLVGMFQREIYVPFIQTYLWYQFQAFAAVFRKRELICTNSKHDYEAKLTSLNYFPFNQTMSRPVCPCKMKNNQQLCTCIIKPAKNSGLNEIRTQNLCETSECRSYHWSIKLNGSFLLWEFVIYAPCDQRVFLSSWWGGE